MRYVGMDVHWNQVTLCVLDSGGRVEKRAVVRGHWRKAVSWVQSLGGPLAICYEASTGYGWLYERLSDFAERVEVAHPGHLRLIFRSKRKHDRIDAERLAKLLYLDEVPPIWVPSGDVRSWRSAINHRNRLVAERTRAKNAVRAMLREHGIQAPKGLWTKRGIGWLKDEAFARELDGLRRDMLVERIESASAMIKRAEEVLDRTGRSHPGVALLMTVPGVGIRTAEAVVAWIDRPGRFARNKHVGSYFGLVPSQDQSGGANRLGHITRQGPSVARKLLVEAAWQGVRHSARIRRYFGRVRRGDRERTKTAIVATAHYMLRVMLAMLNSGEVWRPEAA